MTDPIFKKAKETIQQMIDANKKIESEDKRKRESFLSSLAVDISGLLRPLMDRVAEIAKINRNDLREAMKDIKIEIPKIEVPKAEVSVNIPEIRVPRPEVNVNIPDIKIPKIDIPDVNVNMPDKMNIDGKVSLKDISRDKPMPVELVDSQGAPYIAFGGSAGGGKIKQYHEADVDSLIIGLAAMAEKDDMLIPLQLGSGVSDRALRVVQATDSAVSVTISGFTSSIASVPTNAEGVKYNSDNPLPVTGTFSSGPISYASDSVGSQNIIQLGGNAIALNNGVLNAGTLRTTQAVDSVSSVNVVQSVSLEVKQVSGSVDSVNVLSSVPIDISPNQAGDAKTAETLRVLQVVDSVSSVNIVSQTQSLDVKQVSGSSFSTSVLDFQSSLDVKQVSGVAFSSAIQGISRTTNPTATGNGSAVVASYDDLGRQLTRPIQVRDLIATAYVTITTGIETTLLAGVASTFLDPLHIICSNESNAAVNLDFRSGTAGSVMFSVSVPANATAGFIPTIPIPQTEVAQAWTVDNDGSDVSNTTVNISALFSKEI